MHVITVIWWWGRLFVQDPKLVLLSLEVLVAVVANLAVWASFVRATMSRTGISLVRSVRYESKTY